MSGQNGGWHTRREPRVQRVSRRNPPQAIPPDNGWRDLAIVAFSIVLLYTIFVLAGSMPTPPPPPVASPSSGAVEPIRAPHADGARAIDSRSAYAGPAMTAPSVSGIATWYDWHTGQAAAGPALRKALGPHWRHSTVRVCATRCVTVTLTDWCACGGGRVIDLDDKAFARLAPLSQGVVKVRVTLIGAIDAPSTSRPTAPPTDTEGKP